MRLITRLYGITTAYNYYAVKAQYMDEWYTKYK